MGEFIEVHTSTDNFRLDGRPCEISAYSFVQKDRNDPPERTYFNTPPYLNEKVKKQGSTYDRLFKCAEGYNNKLHRDDREHSKLQGLTVNNEEKDKIVPSLASSEYGHRLDHHLENRDRKHVRIAHVQSEFYRRNMYPNV